MATEQSPAADVPKPLYREEHHPEDAAFVRGVSVEGLKLLFDALQAMDEAITGIVNRPRAAKQDAVTDWLDVLSERFSDVRAYAMEELQRRPMSGDRFDDEGSIAYVASWILKGCGGHLLETLPDLLRMKLASDQARHGKTQERRS